jgi:hypothetical protein
MVSICFWQLKKIYSIPQLKKLYTTPTDTLYIVIMLPAATIVGKRDLGTTSMRRGL